MVVKRMETFRWVRSPSDGKWDNIQKRRGLGQCLWIAFLFSRVLLCGLNKDALIWIVFGCATVYNASLGLLFATPSPRLCWGVEEYHCVCVALVLLAWHNNARACAVAEGVRGEECSVPGTESGTELALPARLPIAGLSAVQPVVFNSPTQTHSALLTLPHALHSTTANFSSSTLPLCSPCISVHPPLSFSLFSPATKMAIEPPGPDKSLCENRKACAEMLRQSGFLTWDSPLEPSPVHWEGHCFPLPLCGSVGVEGSCWPCAVVGLNKVWQSIFVCSVKCSNAQQRAESCLFKMHTNRVLFFHWFLGIETRWQIVLGLLFWSFIWVFFFAKTSSLPHFNHRSILRSIAVNPPLLSHCHCHRGTKMPLGNSTSWEIITQQLPPRLQPQCGDSISYVW